MMMEKLEVMDKENLKCKPSPSYLQRYVMKRNKTKNWKSWGRRSFRRRRLRESCC